MGRHQLTKLYQGGLHFAAVVLLILIAQNALSETTQFPITIQDSRETTLLVPSAPRTIVSLSPSLTEILFAVDAGDHVKGVTTYCNYPETAVEIEKIGGFSAKTISVEKIMSLEPDLVFADQSRHGAIIDILENYGIIVVATNATSIEDCYSVIELVGRATGNLELSLDLIKSMRSRVGRVTEVTGDIPMDQRPRVFWEVFDAPLMTAGPATFIGQLIELAGGTNIFSDVEESWPQISHEALLERNPEVLMSSDSHGEKFTVEQVKSRTGWGELTAVKSERIYLFDGDTVSRPGPRIVDALELMAAALYPELF